MSMCEYETVVLGSGGHKGSAMLGVMHYLQSHGYLRHVKRWVGCSVGAIISVLMAVGYRPIDIVQVARSDAVRYDFDCMSVLSLITDFCMIKPEKLRATVRAMLENGLDVDNGSELTLSQFRDITGFTIITVAYDTVELKTAYIGPDEYPNIPVVDAVIASASLPVVFPPVVYGNHVFVDGGVTCEFPIDAYDDGSNVIGVWVSGNVDRIRDAVHPFVRFFGRKQRNDPSPRQSASVLVPYLMALMSGPTRELDTLRRRSVSNTAKLLIVPVESPATYEQLANTGTLVTADMDSQYIQGFEYAKTQMEGSESD